MLPSANAHFAWNDGLCYPQNGLLWLSPSWLCASCRSKQILWDLPKIIQAVALRFEQHWELQIQDVGCAGQQRRYTGRSTNTNSFRKSAVLPSALTLSSVSFLWAQRAQFPKLQPHLLSFALVELRLHPLSLLLPVEVPAEGWVVSQEREVSH